MDCRYFSTTIATGMVLCGYQGFIQRGGPGISPPPQDFENYNDVIITLKQMQLGDIHNIMLTCCGLNTSDGNLGAVS